MSSTNSTLQDDDEDVFLEKSELGKYATMEEVQAAFTTFSERMETTKCSVFGLDSHPKPDSIPTSMVTYGRQMVVSFNRLLEMVLPSRFTRVVQLYGKYLNLFPENQRILENIFILKSLEKRTHRSNAILSARSRILEAFTNQQISFFVPVIFGCQIIFNLLERIWYNSTEIAVVECLEALTCDIHNSWDHLLLLSVFKPTEKVCATADSMMLTFKQCLLSLSDAIEREIKLMPAPSAHILNLEERTFITKEEYFRNTFKEPNRNTGLTELQSLVELVLEQVLEYCFRLCLLYWSTQQNDSTKYDPSLLKSLVLNLRATLKCKYWNVWEEYMKEESLAAEELTKKETKILDKFTKESKLLQTTKVFQDKLQIVLNLLNNIQQILTAKNHPCSNQNLKTELLNLKITLNKELVALQNLIAVENRLIDEMTDNINSSEASQLHKAETLRSISTVLETNEEPKEINQDVKTTFENEIIGAKSDCTDELQRQDEVFELISGGQDEVRTKTAVEDDPIEKSTALAQKVLLDQLRNTLKPRREDMKNREREAYFRTYGKYPDEDEDEQELPPSRTNLVSQAEAETYDNHEFLSDNSGFETEDDDEIVEGDRGEVIRERPAFAKLLDQMLSGDTTRVREGIVPLQKHDSHSSKSSSDSEYS